MREKKSLTLREGVKNFIVAEIFATCENRVEWCILMKRRVIYMAYCKVLGGNVPNIIVLLAKQRKCIFIEVKSNHSGKVPKDALLPVRRGN